MVSTASPIINFLSTRVRVRSEYSECKATQRMKHLLLFFLLATGPPIFPPAPPFSSPSSSRPRTATSRAVSKMSCTPFISFEEHSIYIAPILSATARPCCCVTGVRPWVLRSSMQVLLLRRSDLRPQRIMGVVGQKWRTSGYHCDMLEFGPIFGKVIRVDVPYQGRFRVS